MYRLGFPSAPLLPYIENYWFVDHDPGEDVSLRVDVFVDARADLIFNFEAPYVREVVGGPSRELHRSNLDAQRLVPIRIRQHGSVRIVGVRFRIGGLAPFTEVPLSPWTGRTVPPEAILGAGVSRLEPALNDANEPSRRTALLDDFFMRRLRIDDAQRIFERALAKLLAADSPLPSEALADAASATPRQVQRLFAHRLGLPPRTTARILRFQRAIRQLMVDPEVPLAEIAADAGFYDQAHLVREFRQFTGGVPRGYRGYFPPEGPADFAPNVVAYIQDSSTERYDTGGAAVAEPREM